MPRLRSALLSLVFGGALALALAGPASAGVITKLDPSGDGKGSGLTAKERAALDIVSVEATGEAGLGLIVTVTFRGNVTKALGKGHLKRGAVALLLEPKSSSQNPAGVLTRGAGAVGDTFRRTSTEAAGVIREGRKLTFYVFGPGLENVGTISVKAFARVAAPPARPAAPAGDSLEDVYLGALLVSFFVDTVKFDLDEIADLPLPLDCLVLPLVRDRLAQFLEYVTAARDALEAKSGKSKREREQLRLLRSAVTEIENQIDRVEELFQERCVFLLAAVFAWSFFGPNEVIGIGRFTMPEPGRGPVDGARVHGSASPIDAIRVVVPNRTITNYLCPAKLPIATISTTASGSDTLTCTGGSIAVGEQFQLNVRMAPSPAVGMGGQIYGRQDGEFRGPFAITGP